MIDPTILNTKAYDLIAAEYAAEAENRPQIIERGKFIKLLNKPAFILDVGCGSGKEGAYFISQGYEAMGIDLSTELLKAAKKYHPELPTQLMDMRHLKFTDNSIDGVWANASLLHLDKRDIIPTLNEFYRVLKNGGICYVMVKEGTGEVIKSEAKSRGIKRFFSLFTLSELNSYFSACQFKILESYQFNGQERDLQARDQNWLVVFAQKE